MNKIDTIIFDFGGMLGADANSWTRDSEVVDKTGLSASEINQLFFNHWDNLKVGKEDLAALFKDVAEKSKYPITIDALREIYHRKITINPDIFALAKLLSPSYKIYILANESLEGMGMKNKKFNLDQYFLKIFNSAELGLFKPDPQIFITLLNEIKSQPENMLFIDDQEKNIIAAEKLGIKSILFTDVEKLKSALEPFLKGSSNS